MQGGFSEFDITPRTGVQLFGFGPYLNRVSADVRDPLGTRAAVLRSDKGSLYVIIGCDLGALQTALVQKVREIVCAAIPELTPERIMVCCSHTHSAPAIDSADRGWGHPDQTYMEILPWKIAQAAIDAFGKMEEVTCSAAVVPCRHIGVNRLYDNGNNTPLEEVLKDDWEPAHPEFTDTEAKIMRFDGADGSLKGFFAYFGCHPVVCCKQNNSIHGDYPGVAIHKLMKENPGSVGLFLLGGHADVNSGCVHREREESLAALDVLAERFAKAIRNGLEKAERIPEDMAVITHTIECSTRVNWDMAYLKEKKAEFEALLHRPEASDAGLEERRAAFKLQGVNKLIRDMESGAKTTITAEIYGLRIGDAEILGAPFEIMQAIKNETFSKAAAPFPMVVSMCNGSLGYAPDRTQLARTESYEATTGPFILGQWALAAIHDELVSAFLEIDGELFSHQRQ